MDVIKEEPESHEAYETEHYSTDEEQFTCPVLRKEGTEEAWHVTSIKEELKDEITSEQHEVRLDRLYNAQEVSLAVVTTFKEDVKDEITEEREVCMDSIEQFNIKQEHGTTSSESDFGETVVHEWDCTGETDPLLLSETDGGCCCRLVLYSGSEKNNCHKCELKSKETLRHLQDKPFRCDLTRKGFTEHGNLMAQARVYPVGKPSKCELSNSRIHTGGKHFNCVICNKSFTTADGFEIHSRTHTVERPFKCEVCNKGFKKSAHLENHSRTHTGEKPFKCGVCNKSFSQTGVLVAHSRTHTGEKPFKCELCHRNFGTSSNLVTHSLIHTGEKPFKCDVCNKSFKQSSYVKVHKRTHTGEKPFKCEVCNNSFTRFSYLKIHKLKHTFDKPL